MKAVLVANVDGDRLYYVVDSKTRFNDGVITSKNGESKLVDFWPTVKSSESLIQITNTKFHEVLWGEGEGTGKEYWHSCFVAKRFSVEDSLLKGVVIKNDIFDTRLKFEKITNRAIDFKTSLSSPDQKSSFRKLGQRIGDGVGRATGRARGFRAGATFNQDAVDADMDGFVQEGTQFARPSVPGKLPDLPDSDTSVGSDASEGQKKNSKRRSVGSVARSISSRFHFFDPAGDSRTKTRWLDRSSVIIDAEFKKQEDTINSLYNDGKKISSVGDAKKVLSQLSPKSSVDFLDAKNDNDVLSPYEEAIFLGLAHGIHIAPHLKKTEIRFKKSDVAEQAQGSQQMRIPIFIASGRKMFEISSRPPALDPVKQKMDDRRTRDASHTIHYADELGKASRVRGGRVRNGRYQRGTFDSGNYDLTSIRVAAAYLFEDDDDPDYKKFRELSEQIERRKSTDVNDEITEQLQKEYEMLKELFEKSMSNLVAQNPRDLDQRVEQAKLAMMRAVMIHETGHSAHQEKAYQDGIDAATKIRDAHVKKYQAMHARMKEIADISSAGPSDKEVIQALQDEYAKLDTEISTSLFTSEKDLAKLSGYSGPELFPFYTWHLAHGGGSKNAERKIAEELLDRQSTRTISDLMSIMHGSFQVDPINGPDINPQTWFTSYYEITQSHLQQIAQLAGSVGDIAKVAAAQSDMRTLDAVMNEVMSRTQERMKENALDKNGKFIPMSREMFRTLDKLRSQSTNAVDMSDAIDTMIMPRTAVGSPMKIRDVLDFVALGMVYGNRKVYRDGSFDPEIGVNSMMHQGSPEFGKMREDLALLTLALQNNFSFMSDVASMETRETMVEAIRRLGLVNQAGHPDPFAASETMVDKVNSLMDSVSISDTFAGMQVPNPLDESPNAAAELIDQALMRAIASITGDRQDYETSKNAGSIFMHTVIGRHTYDDLTTEEIRMLENIAKYGGGSPQAAYMSTLKHVPIAEWLRPGWGENRVELFSELAVIAALRLSLYSAERDSSDVLLSRKLNKREIEVLKKLLSWYQPGAELNLGSASLPKDR
jgi:hypothetical protein